MMMALHATKDVTTLRFLVLPISNFHRFFSQASPLFYCVKVSVQEVHLPRESTEFDLTDL